jgi:ubiquinone/menaquinone biosynthesis C-methylase UbiE
MTRAYLTALRFDSLTRFYDIVVEATLPAASLRAQLIAQVDVRPGMRVLDVGCGTGTLLLTMKQAQPAASYVGLDADPRALAIARRKLDQLRTSIELVEGSATDPPQGIGVFDRVVSSLVFHHLSHEAKRQAFRSIRGLLRQGGEFHVLDWGQAQTRVARAAFLAVQLLDGFTSTSENVRAGLVPALTEAGFARPGETARRATLFGTISLYRSAIPPP